MDDDILQRVREMRLNDRDLHSGVKIIWIGTGVSVWKVNRAKRVSYSLSF
jgi:hypothetical protein